MNITITKYEQSAFTLSTRNKLYAVDFGSFSSYEVIHNIGKPDAAIVSHKHGDHFLPQHLNQFSAPIWAPSDVIEQMPDTTLRCNTLIANEWFEIDHVKVLCVPCDHGPLISEPIENYGYLFKIDDWSVYYVGDMGKSSSPPLGSFDVVLIPVGGRKVFDIDQAIEFLETINHTKLVIPIHYHGNSDPLAGKKFQELAGHKFDICVLDVGDELELTR